MKISVLICLSCLCGLLSGVEPLSAAKLAELKEATVFIKTNYGTGSGFLLKKSVSSGFIVTNHHVVHSQADRPASIIQTVFNSGTKKEFMVPAKIVVAHKAIDLAILEVKSGVLPHPVSVRSDLELRETLPLYIFGFPFGEMLSNNNGNPEVTVGTGTISSLRKSKWGHLEFVQIDGDLNPGNSGGPVVTSKGDLVGVAVSTLMGTQVSRAVPSTRLENMLNGFAHETTVTVLSADEKEVKWRVSMKFTDPLNKVRSPYFYYAEKSKVGQLPGPDTETGLYTKPISKMKRLKMTMKDAEASVEFTVKGNGENEQYYFQYSFVNGEGERKILWPTEHTAVFKTGSGSALADRSDKSNSKEESDVESFSEPLIEDEAPTGPIDLTETITQTPKIITNAIIAGGGRYLVIQYEDMPMLTVYDIADRKVSKMIRIPGRNFKYTAGGYKALVYLNANNLLMTFDLKSGEKIKTKPNPFGNVVCNLLMGSRNDQVAFVRYAAGTEQLSRADNGLLNLNTLTPHGISEENQRAARGRNTSYRDFVHRRCTPDMGVISEWCTSHSPQGFNVYKRNGSNFKFKYEHSSYGCLAVGDNGNIYSSNGVIYNSDMKKIGQISGQQLFPGVGGSMFMGLETNSGRLSFYLPGTKTPVATISDMAYMKNFKQDSWIRTTFAFDRRVIFNQRYNSIIMIPRTNDKIIQRGFDLETTLKESGVDYLFVVSQPKTTASKGEDYEYKIQTKSSSGSVTFDLEFGPKGMKLSKEGVLTWKPGSRSLAKESVIILVQDSGGEQVYHNFEISVN